jgi:F-type H+-transporting ATPase subunit epsilon
MAESEPSGTLDVVVVSPARPIFEGEARWVTAPAWDRLRSAGRGLYRYGPPAPERSVVGQLGILPRHAPLVAALGSGILRIGETGGKIARFAVRGGFLKVGDDKVTILVDSAVAEADVNTSDAQQDLEETIAALRHPETDGEFAELLDRRAWSEARLKLAGSEAKTKAH